MYEINKNTYALIRIDENTTEVIEKENNFILNESLTRILKESCEYYGSTFEGRIKGSKKQLGMRYKLPIIVEEYNEIVMFPTSSSTNDQCSWLALKHIQDYEILDNNTIITFKNNEKKVFPISYTSLENQIFRATKLLLISRQRRNLEK